MSFIWLPHGSKYYPEIYGEYVSDISDSCFQQLFHTPGLGFISDEVYLIADEVSITPVLNETVEKFPTVSFGSYPKLFHRLVITAWLLSSRKNNM